MKIQIRPVIISIFIIISFVLGTFLGSQISVKKEVDQNEIMRQERLQTYRNECQVDYKEKVQIIDDLIERNPSMESEVAQNLIIKVGLAKNDGTFIDEDVWVKNCVDKKVSIFE